MAAIRPVVLAVEFSGGAVWRASYLRCRVERFIQPSHQMRKHQHLAGCGKSPSAAFSHRSAAHRTVRVRFAPLLAAALLDGLFCASCKAIQRRLTPRICGGYGTQHEFFRNLLESDPGKTA